MSQVEAVAGERKTAVVTGGSGGIGCAICQMLAEAGYRVVVGYNASANAASRLVSDLPGGGHQALAIPVTNSIAMTAAARKVAEDYGCVDLLVNAAGMTRFVPHDDLEALDDDLIQEILDVNVRGVIVSVRTFMPLLRAAGAAVIVNISSIAAVTGMGSNIAYCASKAAVDNLTISLARAFSPTIRVVSVSPGLVATEFVKGLDEKWRELQAGRTPLGRLAEPREVAAAVLSAAEHFTFTTGAILPVDGGRKIF